MEGIGVMGELRENLAVESFGFGEAAGVLEIEGGAEKVIDLGMRHRGLFEGLARVYSRYLAGLTYADAWVITLRSPGGRWCRGA